MDPLLGLFELNALNYALVGRGRQKERRKKKVYDDERIKHLEYLLKSFVSSLVFTQKTSGPLSLFFFVFSFSCVLTVSLVGCRSDGGLSDKLGSRRIPPSGPVRRDNPLRGGGLLFLSSFLFVALLVFLDVLAFVLLIALYIVVF